MSRMDPSVLVDAPGALIVWCLLCMHSDRVQAWSSRRLERCQQYTCILRSICVGARSLSVHVFSPFCFWRLVFVEIARELFAACSCTRENHHTNILYFPGFCVVRSSKSTCWLPVPAVAVFLLLSGLSCLRQANVAIDFRGTGILALKGMAFFCQNYERKVNECSSICVCVGPEGDFDMWYPRLKWKGFLFFVIQLTYCSSL